jgi:hypothetical protein
MIVSYPFPWWVSGHAPFAFPEKIACALLGRRVLGGCDLTAVVKLTHNGVRTTAWVMEHESGDGTLEVHARYLESANNQERGNIKAGRAGLGQLGWG